MGLEEGVYGGGVEGESYVARAVSEVVDWRKKSKVKGGKEEGRERRRGGREVSFAALVAAFSRGEQQRLNRFLRRFIVSYPSIHGYKDKREDVPAFQTPPFFSKTLTISRSSRSAA